MCAELICRRYCYRDKETYFFEINQLSESSHEAISLCNAVKGNDISSYGHRDYVSIYANICAPVIWFKSVKTGILEFVSAITKLLGYSPQDFYQTLASGSQRFILRTLSLLGCRDLEP